MHIAATRLEFDRSRARSRFGPPERGSSSCQLSDVSRADRVFVTLACRLPAPCSLPNASRSAHGLSPIRAIRVIRGSPHDVHRSSGQRNARPRAFRPIQRPHSVQRLPERRLQAWQTASRRRYSASSTKVQPSPRYTGRQAIGRFPITPRKKHRRNTDAFILSRRLPGRNTAPAATRNGLSRCSNPFPIRGSMGTRAPPAPSRPPARVPSPADLVSVERRLNS
jgi:hypothetical protein